MTFKKSLPIKQLRLGWLQRCLLDRFNWVRIWHHIILFKSKMTTALSKKKKLTNKAIACQAVTDDVCWTDLITLGYGIIISLSYCMAFSTQSLQ